MRSHTSAKGIYRQETDNFTPCVINHELDGKKAYATNDLVVQHPTNRSLWRLIGRTDDQIMHSTGLKVSSHFLLLSDQDA